MRIQKLLMYLAILLVVAAGYLFSEYYQARQVAQEKEAKKVFQVQAAALQRLILKSDKGEIRLEKAAPADTAEGSATSSPPATPTPAWRLVAPIQAATDELTVTSLVTALADLKVERRLDEIGPDRRQEFGLDKPIFTLTFEAAGQTRTLHFGGKVPGSQFIYAQVEGDPRLLVLRQADKETLDRTLTALRAKEIFTLKPTEVTEIRLIRPQEQMILQKSGGEVWAPAAPHQIKIRQDRVKALVNQLAHLKAVDFVAEKAEDLKKYGFAPTPALRLTLRRQGQEETLLIGNSQGDRYYAQVAGKAPIFLVDKLTVDRLPTSYEALEERRLWTGPEAEVQKLIWGPPEAQTVAVRGQESWTIQTATGQQVTPNATKVQLTLWRLQELEFKRLLPDTAGLATATPQFTIQLLGANNALLYRLASFAPEKDQVPLLATVGEQTRAVMVAAPNWQELKGLLERLAEPEKGKAEP